ncbi:MAG TPA: SGNH/GDSL hydrolase family protein [Hydrogenophaga sp.]|uniref:SGNH/GDSL hydrolase family protein n=1 Tax=Hydrogenophaga sp. TaxID=1904254 RepID=UPI002B84E15A|nr:SGNH/GDSL hydrolase family protein [Hydrogenophaga sp.]HMN93275.1 SGNH/GDSL hydrolase family protein [Hydrogenophaga sp.]HMP10838.1 SGNH/GDSL hydrolase family protein [Hydrogenophaga sp.]
MLLRTTLSAAALALLLVACGGGNDYERLVSFGDSLSDVGSYRTPGIASVGGGKYTVNGTGNKIWVEHIADAAGLPAPCAAQTGLNASGPLEAFAAPVQNNPGCTVYSQGGSRVTDPIGPANAALTASPDPAVAAQGLLGQLTVPLVTQVANHLSTHGSFRRDDLVLVLAGGNDLFMLSGAIPARVAELAPTLGVEAATQQAAGEAVEAMGVAGGELANLVRTQVLARGARRVVVVNLPNVGLTPSSIGQGPQAQALASAMSQAFNSQLAAGLANVRGVLLVDAYTRGTTQATDGTFTNATTPACDTASPLNPLQGSSLTCTTASTLTGVDVSRYAYADSVHPTPYAHRLLADFVEQEMRRVGWF